MKNKNRNFQAVKLPIIEKRIVASNTMEVSFGLNGQNFPFAAGQYVKITIPELIYPDQTGNSRLFSIASSPNEKARLRIVFRNSGSGFKKTLTELPAESLVEIQGPYGLFALPKEKNQSIVFVTGGVGIAPCLSMIKFSIEEKLNNQICLLYGNYKEEDAAYLEDLTILEKQNPNFSLKNKFGLIDQDFIKSAVSSLDNKLWYVVGPPPMVEAVKNILDSLGVKKDKVRLENF